RIACSSTGACAGAPLAATPLIVTPAGGAGVSPPLSPSPPPPPQAARMAAARADGTRCLVRIKRVLLRGSRGRAALAAENVKDCRCPPRIWGVLEFTLG